MEPGKKRKKKNEWRRNCQDIRAFFRPVPKIEPNSESTQSALQEKNNEERSEDEEDGFYVAAPHIMNSPPKLSPIPLFEDTPPPSPECKTPLVSSDSSSSDSESEDSDAESTRSISTALQFRFDLACDDNLPELELIEYHPDSESDTIFGEPHRDTDH